jgi:hypothetical protein
MILTHSVVPDIDWVTWPICSSKSATLVVGGGGNPTSQLGYSNRMNGMEGGVGGNSFRGAAGPKSMYAAEDIPEGAPNPP